jgi:glycosyltransferase involved in cell wall biosynthesis
MRMLLINYELPPLGGGAGNATAHIARCLAAVGTEILVLTMAHRGLPTREYRDGYTIWRAPALRRHVDQCTPGEMLTFLAGAAPLTIAIGRRWAPDVVCAFFAVPCGPLALLLRHSFGVPYLVSLRGGDVPGFMGEDLAKLHRLALPVILTVWRHSSGLIANSPGLIALAHRAWPEAPIELIPNGVDVDAFYPPACRRVAHPLRLLYVGRLARQKGIDHLLTALARSRSSACLRVVGDGPERARLERAAEVLALAGRVQFVGWSRRSDLLGHYHWADVFILPSLDEGMPNVVLEAQAAGLPVVGTAVAGTRDLIEPGHTGCLVPPSDPDALASTIDMLDGDADLVRALGKNSRDAALGRRWEGVAERYRWALASAARHRDGRTAVSPAATLPIGDSDERSPANSENIWKQPWPARLDAQPGDSAGLPGRAPAVVGRATVP